MFEYVQYELLKDLADAHGEGLAVHARAELAGANELDQPPDAQTLLFAAQLHPVLHKTLLHPAAPHRLRQLPQEVLNLQGITGTASITHKSRGDHLVTQTDK